MRSFALPALLALILAAQTGPPPAPPADYVCPMDRDIRSVAPGSCPRCGMKLVLGIPDPVEYPVNLAVAPPAPSLGASVNLTFQIRDPKTGAPVTRFETVHEKLFHLFIVSQDLEFFVHQHPTLQTGGAFHWEGRLPKRGMYRVLADFYPTGGMPQLIARTVFAGGAPSGPPHLAPDLAPKHCANLDVELATEPAAPIAGFKTLLFFRLKPAEGLEPYLGAWAHMLAASDDLIDLIHTHPFLADGGPQVQFNVIFPRARTYRLWVQFQRHGVVNTASFTIKVGALE